MSNRQKWQFVGHDRSWWASVPGVMGMKVSPNGNGYDAHIYRPDGSTTYTYCETVTEACRWCESYLAFETEK